IFHLRMLVNWAAIALLRVTHGRVPPPICARRVFPSGGFAFAALPTLKPDLSLRLFFYPVAVLIEAGRRGRPPAAKRLQAAFCLFITSSAMRPVSSAIWSNFAR